MKNKKEKKEEVEEVKKVLTKEEEAEKEIIEKDVSKYAKLESLSLSEGGVLLMDGLKSDIGSCIDKLISSYKTSKHVELLATIAQLDTKVNMHKALSRSSKNKKFAKDELDLILK